jgi:hypothetical protein
MANNNGDLGIQVSINLKTKEAQASLNTWINQNKDKIVNIKFKDTNLDNLNKKIIDATKYWQGRFKDSVKSLTANNTELTKMKQYYSELEKSSAQFAQNQKQQDKTYWNNMFQKSLKDLTSTNDELVKMREYYSELEKSTAKVALNNDKEAKSLVTAQNQAQQLYNKLKQIGANRDFTKVFEKNPQYKKDFDALERSVGKFNVGLKDGTYTAENWKNANLSNNVKTLSANLQTAEKRMGGFTSEVLRNALAFAQWYVLGNIISNIARSVSTGIKTIKDLDTAMTELRKVSSETEEVYRQIYIQANQTAKAIGISTKAVIDSTAAWSALGYSVKDASEMAKNAAILSNISENMNIDDATQTLSSTIKAFGLNIEGSLDGIISKINIVGNNFGVTNTQISQGLLESSAAMAVANNTLDETVGLIASIVEITGDASEAGNALKSVSMRIRGLSEDGSGVDEELTNIKDTIKDLTGVSLFTDETQQTYKSTFEILKEISKVFTTLSDKKQADVLNLLAGKQRGQVVAAALTNFATAEKAVVDQAKSAGSALAEQEKKMQSISAKINILKETITGFWQNLISADFIKAIVDIGTKLASALDIIVNKTGSLIPILLTSIVLYTAINALKNTTIGLTISETAATVKNIASRIAISAAYVAETFAVYGLHAGLLALKTATLGLMAANPLMWITVGVAAIFGLVKGLEALVVTFDEQKQKVQALKAEYDNLTSNLESLASQQQSNIDKINELNDIRDKSGLTEAEQAQLDNLLKINEQLQLEINYQKELKNLKNDELQKESVALLTAGSQKDSNTYISAYANPDEIMSPNISPVEKLKQNTQLIKDYQSQLDSLDQKYRDGIITGKEWRDQTTGIKDAQTALITETDSLVTTVQDAATNITDTTGANYDLKTSAEAAVKAAKEEIISLNGLADSAEKASDVLSDVGETNLATTVKNEIAELQKAKDTYDALSDAVKEYDDQLFISQDTLDTLEKLIPGVTSALYDENGKLKDSAIAALASTESFLKFISAQKAVQYEAAKANYQNQVDELNNLANAAASAGDWLAGVAIMQGITSAASDMAKAKAEFESITELIRNIGRVSAGGSGSTKSAIEKLDEAFQKLIGTEERQLKILSYQEGSEQAQIEALKKLQDMVHRQADLYRSMGYKNESSHIQSLKLLWLGYANDIEQINKSILDKTNEAQKDSFDKLSDLTNSLVDNLKAQQEASDEAYQNKIDALKEARDQVEAENELIKDQNDLYKAQQELLNASSERNVKMLQNGKWVWTTGDLSKYREAVQNAQDKLSKTQADQAFENQIKELERQQKIASDGYQTQIKVLESMLQAQESLLNGNVNEIINSLGQLSAALKQYGISLSGNFTDGLTVSTGSGITTTDKTGTTTSSQSRTSVINQMKANSAAWFTASADGRNALSNNNQNLGKSIGLYYKNGAWYTDPNYTIRAYHRGSSGIGGETFDPRQEELAKLAKGEMVWSKDMVLNGIKMVDTLKLFAGRTTNNNVTSTSGDSFGDINIVTQSSNVGNIIQSAKQIKNLRR